MVSDASLGKTSADERSSKISMRGMNFFDKKGPSVDKFQKILDHNEYTTDVNEIKEFLHWAIKYLIIDGMYNNDNIPILLSSSLSSTITTTKTIVTMGWQAVGMMRVIVMAVSSILILSLFNSNSSSTHLFIFVLLLSPTNKEIFRKEDPALW